MTRRSAAYFSWALAACLLAAIGGCGVDRERGRGAKGLLDLVRTTGPTPSELAAMAMDPYDPNARYVGTFGLASAFFASEPAYIALFEDNADDEDPSVRAAAIRGLANHGEPRHVPILINGLSDPDKVVRVESARGLQRLHNPIAVDPLLAAIREPGAVRAGVSEAEPEVRVEAAAALGQYAQGKVIDGLIAALLDESLAVNKSALTSLRTLTGNDFGLDHASWVEWRNSSRELFAARSLYLYPAFQRDKAWFEYLPFVSPPPNEVAGPPAGLPRTEPPAP